MCTKTECVAPGTNAANPSNPENPETPITPVVPPDSGDTNFDVTVDDEWGGSTNVEVGIG